MRAGIHLPSLVVGVAVVAFGIVLLLDFGGDLDLDFGALAPMLLALVGVALLATGLARRDRG